MSATQPVCLEGALTIVCGQAQRELLLAAIEGTGSECVIDLSAIEAIDSAGVQLLLAAQRSLEERGARLALQAVPPGVRQVFETYGLQALLGGPQKT
jgi:anti-sigma B factor antagonist